MNPNPLRDVGPWNQVWFGGIPVKALLVEIDGVSTKDEWKKQKSKESSGQVNVFAGTTVENPKLTFEAVDEDDFDDLWRLWRQLKPVPGLVGTPSTPSTATATAGANSSTTSSVGSPSAADGSAAKDEAAINEVNADGSGNGTAAAKTSDNPGPRPPTVSVQNAILAWHDILAVARGQWDGPKPTDTRSWRVVLTVVPQKPPTPAGAGAMAPATPTAASTSSSNSTTTTAPDPQAALEAQASVAA